MAQKINVRMISGDLTLKLENSESPPLPPASGLAWRELCDANPRLFDAPIYRVLPRTHDSAIIPLALDSYRRLAIQAHPAVGDLGVRLLGVKAAITALDHAQREHVLIARRHPHTRTYGGLWEVCPGGSVGPRDVPAHALAESAVLAHLAREASEELAIDLLASTDPDPRGKMILDDPVAFSVDVVFTRRWRTPIDPRRTVCRAADRDWEYLDTAWLALDELPAFIARSPAVITPATLAIFSAIGWS